MIFPMMDDATSQALDVSTEEYINTIESMTYEEAQEIIDLVWSEKAGDLTKAKVLYNLYS